MAVLIASLVQLRSELNEAAPHRDHTTDGWIGDSRHQAEKSDHNPDETGNPEVHDADHLDEVHAIDADKDLKQGRFTMAAVVAFLVARCRAGIEKRLRYIIYNRTIWSASSGWTARRYTGSSPHTEHGHFSGSYETRWESNKNRYHLELVPGAANAPKPAPTPAPAPVSLDESKEEDMLLIKVTSNNTMYLCHNGYMRALTDPRLQLDPLLAGPNPVKKIEVRTRDELDIIGGPERTIADVQAERSAASKP